MDNVVIRNVTGEEIPDDWLDSFERYQESVQWYHYEGDQLVLGEEWFVDDWDLEERREKTVFIRQSLAEGAVLIAAFQTMEVSSEAKEENTKISQEQAEAHSAADSSQSETLAGFTLLLPPVRDGYAELSKLHVARSMRHKGLGRALFLEAKKAAAAMNAQWLFMATNPALETQQFYRAVGCEDGRDLLSWYTLEYETDLVLKCKTD